MLKCQLQHSALTLPSMTATQELVVPKSIPMMSPPPDACLAALELQEHLCEFQMPAGAESRNLSMSCIVRMRYLNALRSNGPDLMGRAASDNCKQCTTSDLGISLVECTPISCRSHLRGMQRSQTPAWPGQTRRPARLPVLSVAETLRHQINHTECGPCEAA